MNIAITRMFVTVWTALLRAYFDWLPDVCVCVCVCVCMLLDNIISVGIYSVMLQWLMLCTYVCINVMLLLQKILYEISTLQYLGKISRFQSI